MTGSLDAHLHLWDRRRFHYPWLATSVLPDRFLLEDVGGITDDDGVIVVQANCIDADGLAEARWLDSLAERHPAIVGIVAFAPLEAGAAVEEHLVALRAIGPRVVGVRQLLQDADQRLASPAVVEGLAAVGTAGLVFEACVRAHQLPALVALRRKAAATTFVLDHLGKPPIRAGWGSDAARAWAAALTTLAAEPDTLVKISGLAAEAAPGPLLPQVLPFVDFALSRFGTNRSMLGSDWPVSRTDADARPVDLFEVLTEAVGAGPSERDQLMRQVARRTYLPERSEA